MSTVILLTADRRLYVNADRTKLVEEGDPEGSWLLYAVGRKIGQGDADRYGLEPDKFGRVTYEGCPTLPAPELPTESKKKAKSKKTETEPAAEGGADDSDRNKGEVPTWPGRTSADKYLELYPTGPKAELAKAVIAARDGADGGS